MYVRDLAVSMLRRWYFLAIAIAITVGACLYASKSIPPTFQTEASVVLIPPASEEYPNANRFLELSGLSQAVDVLSRALNADETHELVHQTAPAGKFEVVKDGATSAPVLIITVQAASAAETVALVDAVLQQVPVSLSALQSALSIDPGAEISSMPLARDGEPQLSQKSRLRAIAALTILCLGASALAIGALDGLLLARAARRELKVRPADGPSDTGPDVDDGELDRVWLDSELATISSGAVPADRANARKRRGRQGASSRGRI